MASRRYKNLTAAEQWDADRPRIHALKNKAMAKNPGFGDDNYRDMISDISKGKADSSKALKPAERQELINRLSALAGEETRRSWQPRDKRSYPNRPKNMDRPGQSRDEQLGKIEALLTVGKLPWSYADSIAKQMRLADKIQWVATENLGKVIAALTKYGQKSGWDLSGA